MKVEISGAVPRFPRREIERFVERALRASLALTGRAAAPGLSIAFVGDATMTALNRRYRGRRGTTDVLTFEPDGRDLPGEIVISLDRARRQAREEGHSLATEVRYLLVHGILHALGHDHETDDGEMDALELQVRENVGLE
ncbi:MAG TPA: rRNA maturation RNase YbeY [Thermoanaerobaculia bacterium]|nr:rRNA maturation RNase YbeY [Thermoanaerobaculia bacterium]